MLSETPGFLACMKGLMTVPLIKGGVTRRGSTPYYESAMNLCGDVRGCVCMSLEL